MSHFTSIKTTLKDKELLLQALKDLLHVPQEGRVYVRGFNGSSTKADISIPSEARGYDVGFRLVGGAYELVADWWGVRGIDRATFLPALTQRYAYLGARAKLAEQGFSVATEEVQADGRIHLVLRRSA